MGNGASNVRLDLLYGAWYIEYNGNAFVTVSQILMEESEFFVHQDNIWLSVPSVLVMDQMASHTILSHHTFIKHHHQTITIAITKQDRIKHV